MKKWIGGLIVLIIIVSIFIYVRDDKVFDPTTITNYPPKGSSIVVFGDSLVSGVGAKTPGGFVTMLSDALDIPIENLGRGGDTTAGGLDRIDEVVARSPDIVLVLLGGNDFLSKVPKKEIFTNLEDIISTLHDDGVVVVLLGIRGGIIRDGYQNDFNDLSRKLNTAYVSDVLNGLIGKSEFMDDAIHPNEEGYRIIAERITPIVEALLQ